MIIRVERKRLLSLVVYIDVVTISYNMEKGICSFCVFTERFNFFLNDGFKIYSCLKKNILGIFSFAKITY